MKKLLFFIVFLPFFLTAQKSGKVNYDMTVKIEIPDGVPKEFRDRIPKERNAVKELYFNENVSTYKDGEMERPEDAEISGEGGGRRFRMRFAGGGGQGQTYKDISANLMIDKRNLMGKDFIINDEVPKYQWKVTGQKKQILSYLAMEATTTVDDTINIIAWFTPQIPVSNGPGVYQGLPGLILELDVDNGREKTLANSVELGPLDETLIEIPDKGKKVTREEFDKIRMEKMEEMRERGGGGPGRIRIRRGG